MDRNSSRNKYGEASVTIALTTMLVIFSISFYNLYKKKSVNIRLTITMKLKFIAAGIPVVYVIFMSIEFVVF